MGTSSLNPLYWFERVLNGNQACGYIGLLHWVALAMVLTAMLFDSRELLGVNIWLKPAKFLISSAIYLWTVGWLLNFVETAASARAALGTAVSILILLENAGVSGQALRGERSHFNVTSALNASIFSLMGIMILINTILLGLLLWWFLTKPVAMPLGALWGCRLGLLLAVLASIEGGIMASMASHTVGAPDGGPGVPILNWSKQAGDLRAAHFIGLHGLQVLPLGGFLLSEIGAGGGVFVLALIHYAAFILTFLQAMAKKPLLF
ncbi:MAG: hypothetical protein K7J46_04075 [Bryobacter sp.]|jgi:hypothetical protein|nr:hypothetical protein [Bryobacter sp. CoA8 C33]